MDVIHREAQNKLVSTSVNVRYFFFVGVVFISILSTFKIYLFNVSV